MAYTIEPALTASNVRCLQHSGRFCNLFSLMIDLVSQQNSKFHTLGKAADILTSSLSSGLFTSDIR